MKKGIKFITQSLVLLGVVSIISIASTTPNAELEKELKETKEKLAIAEQNLLIAEQSIEDLTINESLDKWEIFTLAIMKVESNYNITAKSSAGASGYFQFMPVYVAEVNRIHKTNYKYKDVINSFELSYEVFNLMQEAHNKNFDINKALTLHNGNNKWYHKRVYDEMNRIKKYEEMRRKVVDARSLDI